MAGAIVPCTVGLRNFAKYSIAFFLNLNVLCFRNFTHKLVNDMISFELYRNKYGGMFNATHREKQT